MASVADQTGAVVEAPVIRPKTSRDEWVMCGYLMVIALYFWRRKRPTLPLLIPMVFVMGIALVSLFVKVADFYRAENWLLCGVSVTLLALILWMVLEGLAIVAALRAERDA